MKLKTNKNADWRHLLIGMASGICVFLLSTVIMAVILTKNDLSYGAIKIACFFITIVSAFIAGFIGKKKNRMKGIVCGAVTSVFLLCFEYIVFIGNAGLHLSEEVVLLIPAGLSFGMVGGIVSSNMR